MEKKRLSFIWALDRNFHPTLWLLQPQIYRIFTTTRGTSTMRSLSKRNQQQQEKKQHWNYFSKRSRSPEIHRSLGSRAWRLIDDCSVRAGALEQAVLSNTIWQSWVLNSTCNWPDGGVEQAVVLESMLVLSMELIHGLPFSSYAKQWMVT